MIKSMSENATHRILLDAGGLAEIRPIDDSKKKLKVQMEALSSMGYDVINVIPSDFALLNQLEGLPDKPTLTSANLRNRPQWIRPWVDVTKGTQHIGVIGLYLATHPDYLDARLALEATLKEIPPAIDTIIVLAYGLPEQVQAIVNGVPRVVLAVTSGKDASFASNSSLPLIVAPVKKGMKLTSVLMRRQHKGSMTAELPVAVALEETVGIDKDIDALVMQGLRSSHKKSLNAPDNIDQQYLHMTPQEFINAYSKEQRQ